MKAALVGAGRHAAARGPPRRPAGSAAPTPSSPPILDFAADLRAHGEERVRRARRRGRRRRARHRRRGGRASPSTPRTSAGATCRCASCSPSGSAACPVALGHDVRTGGLAEGRIGAGKGADRFLFVPLGTGIAGRHRHRRARSRRARTATRARSATSSSGPADRTAAAGSAAAWRRWPPPPRSAAPGPPRRGDPEADAADCAKAVESGRPARPCAVWRDAVDALADGLVTALTLLDPRMLIIGGGLAEAGDTLFAPAAGGRRGAGHLPEAPPHRPGGPRGHRRMPGRGSARLGSTLRGGNRLMAATRRRTMQRTVLAGARVVLPAGLVGRTAGSTVEGARIAGERRHDRPPATPPST